LQVLNFHISFLKIIGSIIGVLLSVLFIKHPYITVSVICHHHHHHHHKKVLENK